MTFGFMVLFCDPLSLIRTICVTIVLEITLELDWVTGGYLAEVSNYAFRGSANTNRIRVQRQLNT